jgi:hypothetical protein
VLVDDIVTDVHASLTKTDLGTVNAQGTWMVEVAHPDVMVNGANTLSRARINVHYLGSPTVGAPTKSIATTSSYARVIALDASHELVDVFASGITPAGTALVTSAQLCSDAGGASCGAALTQQQVKDTRPSAQFIKATVTLTSDGFAIPMLDKLTLRYKE